MKETTTKKVLWMMSDLVSAIDALPPHPFLTQAINAVHEAERHIADFSACGGKPCNHSWGSYQFEGDIRCKRCHGFIPEKSDLDRSGEVQS